MPPPTLCLAAADPPLLAVAVTVGAVVATIAAGAWFRRAGWLTEAADASLLSLLVRVFIPALIVSRVLGNDALGDWRNVVVPPAVAFVLVTLGFVAAGVVLRLTGGNIISHSDLRRRRTFVLCVGMFNYGYVTIPLVESLYGGRTQGVLFVFNVGVEAAMWGVGVSILASASDAGRPGVGLLMRRLLSPPVVATVLAVAVNAADPPVPEAVRPVVDAAGKVVGWLADAAIPAGLLLTGATIWQDWAGADLRRGKLVIAVACGVRLLVMPLVFVGLAVGLPDAAASLELRRVLVLQAAMPAAVFPIVLSRHFGGDVGTALRIVVGTSLVSLLTMPLWIALGRFLIE